MDLYLQVLAGGVLNGVVYALIAIGLTIIFGVMRLVNFAHGEMVVIGMYIGYWCFELIGISPLAAMPVAALALFALGYVLQLTVVNAFISRPHHVQFILFISFALVITGLHMMLFGPTPRGIFSMASFETFDIGPLRLDMTRVQAAAGAIVLMALLFVFLRFTTTGQAIRAAADSRIGAEVIGIRINRVFAITAGIGMACAGAAGALVAPMFDTHPFLAPEFTLLAFIVVIIGGLGSIPGAIAGGILIGIVEALAAVMINPSMKSMFSYALLVLVLLVRPAGLFGAAGGRR
ncbi:branched-chain amino acid ABC transporter permease [Amorphus orientalis]|uniref:Branched-chain amino acid transport system permease protein n=1 Tax=Amorphus orientalis TaxID=649198 RepID=A0AAE4AQT7_9HYPH|nr:branched-chain amino acid ABC transporter permease [Amorphus orientalis]MDQ0314456.1 branched-chain amino acid transport system permease protein [Amorphus orientalis]